jgi:N utilization substance protein B
MAAGVRRRARAYALQVLYALDLNPDIEVDEALAAYRHEFEVELDDEAARFATELVGVAHGQAAAIDEVIQGASKNWRIERMSRVDRNILRLATAELRDSGDVPTKVVLNEAIELAKRFGAAESPAFVNGILDRIAHLLRPE